MGDSDNAQDQTSPTKIDRDELDQAVDAAVDGGPEIPGQDQQTHVDRASGDKIDRILDDAVGDDSNVPGLDQ